MALTPFNALPDTARLWIFTAGRKLNDVELPALHDVLSNFLAEWNAHGSGLHAGYEVRYDRFILVGVDEDATAPSGCSIDRLVNTMKEVGSRLGVELVDGPDIAYHDKGEIRCISRSEFMKLAEGGTVHGATQVFDNTLQRIADLRAGRWEVPARESWHGKAFDLQESVVEGTSQP